MVFLGLRDIYNSLEDGYYGVLDKIQRVIPIYSVIDPIDRIFPSFVLVLILLIAGIAGLAYWGLNQGPITPAEKFAFLKILDNDNKPLKNVDVTVVVGEQTLTLTTDPNGIVKIRLADKTTVNATVSVSVSGFKEVTDETVQLTLNQTTSIKLETVALLEGPYVIKIADSETSTLISGVSISISFECEQSEEAAPGQKVVNNGQTVVQKDASCGKLFASFSPASGYQEKNHVEIFTSPQTVELDPIDSDPQLGSIEVTVKDEEAEPVEDAEVHYRLSGSTESPIAAGNTDSAGKARIEELEPGLYEVSAYNPVDGRTAQRTGIRVEADETTIVTLQLRTIGNSKKLFFKIVDSETKQGLAQVNVTAYDNSIKLGNTAPTNSQGVFEKNVDVNLNSSFSAVLYYPGYVLKVIFPNAVDGNQDEPEKIAFEKQKRNEFGAPTNYGNIVVETKNEDGSPLPNTTVNLFRTNYSNPLRTVQTTTDANFLIEALPTTDGYLYYATANSVQHDANGTSEQKALPIGVTITLPIALVTGTGSFKITAVDFDNPNTKIAGALVKAYKLLLPKGQQTVAEGITDSSGVWESNPIKINQNLYLEITAVGRRRFSAGPFALSTREQIIAQTVKLSVLQTAPGDPCAKDPDCSYPQTCNLKSKTCEQACADSSDCKNLPGYYCAANGLCQLPPANYCDDQIACNQACQSCTDNQCTEPVGASCTTNAQCCGLVCDTATQQCRNPGGDACTSDNDCGGNGFSCASCGLDSLGQAIQCCKKTCSLDEDCPAGNACNIEGYCEELAPTTDLKLSFEGIRGADPEDSVDQILAGKEYHAVFRLQLSRAADWNNLEMHFRIGPDSDTKGSNQNAFILSIYPIPGANRDTAYPQCSSTTDLTNVYRSPDSVDCGPTARQGNMKYKSIRGQSDYEFLVKFKAKNATKMGTPIPLRFQARGENKGIRFNTARHSQALSIGGAVCSTNCKPFLWTFFLNAPNGPIINLNQSVQLLDGQLGDAAYKIFYTIQNTTTQDFLNSALAVQTDRPEMINIKTNPAFSNENLSSQSLFEKGLSNPIVFETKEITSSQNLNLNLELITAPPKNDASAKPVIKLKVEPQAPLVLSLRIISAQTIFAVVQATAADGTKVPVQGALVRFKANYSGEACTNLGIPISDYVGECTTDESGSCLLAGLSMQNTSVLVEASKSNYRKIRLCQTINSETQTFGDPLTCLKFKFSNDPNAGEFPATMPTVTRYNRPMKGTTDIALYVKSDCDYPIQIVTATISGLIADTEATVEGLGEESGPKTLGPGNEANGTLKIKTESPLGYIPIRVLAKKDGVELARFIVGRARINATNKQFAVVTEARGQ